MSRLHSSSHQQPRGSASLKGLPLVTVVTLSGVALLLGRSAPELASGPASVSVGADLLAAATAESRQTDRGGAVAAEEELAPIRISADGPRRRAESGDGRDDELVSVSVGGPSDSGHDDGLVLSSGAAADSPLEASDLDGIRAEGPFHLGVREGEWTFFDPQGLERERGSYRAGKRDGAWLQFAPNGQLVQLAEYVDGAQQGAWERFSREGALLEEGQFEASAPHGRWVRRYSNGSIKERGLYEAGLREGRWEFFDDLGRPTLRTGTYRAGIRID